MMAKRRAALLSARAKRRDIAGQDSLSGQALLVVMPKTTKLRTKRYMGRKRTQNRDMPALSPAAHEVPMVASRGSNEASLPEHDVKTTRVPATEVIAQSNRVSCLAHMRLQLCRGMTKHMQRRKCVHVDGNISKGMIGRHFNAFR